MPITPKSSATTVTVHDQGPPGPSGPIASATAPLKIVNGNVAAIDPATSSARGTMSAADKSKTDRLRDFSVAGTFAVPVETAAIGPDNVTDCYPAMAGALQQWPSNNLIELRGDPRAWRIDGPLPIVGGQNYKFRGGGAHNTTVRALAAGGLFVVSDSFSGGGPQVGTIHVEGITFDGDVYGGSLLDLRNSGNLTHKVIAKDLIGKRLGAHIAFNLQGLSEGVFEDITIVDGTGTTTALQMTGPNGRISIDRFDSRGHGSGIILAPSGTDTPQVGGTHLSNFKLKNGIYTRTGFVRSTANFTATSLTDLGVVDFGDPSFGGNTFMVRVRCGASPRLQGTTRALGASGVDPYWTRIAFASNDDHRAHGILKHEIAWFPDSGKAGRILVTANGYSIVDDFYDTTTYERVDGPAANEHFEIWALAYTLISTTGLSTGTKTIAAGSNWFHDTQGNPVTPANGSTYDIIDGFAYGGIHISAGVVRDTFVSQGHISESPGDGFSCFAGRTSVSDVTVEYVDDQGFTFSQGRDYAPAEGYMRTTGVGLRAIDAGRGGFFLGGENLHLVACSVERWGHAQNTRLVPTGSYAAQIGSRDCSFDLTVIAGGRNCEHSGVQIVDSENTDVLVRSARGFAASVPMNAPVSDVTKPIWVYSAYTPRSGLRIKAKDRVDFTPPPGALRLDAIVDIEGTGTPQNVINGAYGSRYVDIANGRQYVKTTATGTLGWKVIQTNDEPDFDFATAFGSDLTAWHRVHGHVSSPAGVTTVADGGTENKPLVAAGAGSSPTFAANASFNNRVVLAGGSGKAVATAAWSAALSQPFTVVFCGLLPGTVVTYRTLLGAFDCAFPNPFSTLDAAPFYQTNGDAFECYAGVRGGSGTNPFSTLFAGSLPFVCAIEFDHAGGTAKVWVNDCTAPAHVLADPGPNQMKGYTALASTLAGTIFAEATGGYFAESAVIKRKLTSDELRDAMLGMANPCGIEVVT